MGNFKVKYALSVAIMLLLSQIILGFATMQRAMAAKPVIEESQIISEFSAVSQQDSIRNANARRVAQRSRRTQEEQRNAASSISTNTTSASVDTVNVTALADTTQRKSKGGMGLGAPIVGRAQDSLYYDLRSKKVYLYEKGEVTYGDMSLAADKMTIDLDLKNIYAIGKTDTIDGEPTTTRPLFSQGTTSLNMDTITYNIESQRAKIKNIATQQGDGWMVGQDVKRLSDNTINIADGMYTTCDQTDHPHFFYSMSKVKVIPGKKAIMGPGHLVIEDVHIPFLGLPEGFFPLSSGPKSGILMPSYGEEARRGFYIRGLGYYFTFSDHMDLTLTGGIYTLGSWEVNAISRYMKRYKYTGNFNFDFSSIRSGDKGDPDFVKQNTYRLMWTHSQDAKANPGSTFSASVNLSSSGYSRYSATNLNDMLSTQTNSSISYSKNWAGTPFSMSMNLAVSQNSQTKAIAGTLPNISFNVAKFYPLRRSEKVGKDRWYEKISMSYAAKMTNSVSAQEDNIFSRQTLDNMRHGVQHNIPVQATFNLFNYINITPSANYAERWYFKKVERQWNPETGKVENLDPEYGFYRLYNYNTAVSLSTIVYGTWQVKEKYKDFKLQGLRHQVTPQVSFSYAPDFSNQKYGYYQTVQADSTGRTTVYSPFSDNAFGVPTSGRNMAMSFSLRQSLEAKVKSKRDTTGLKKIKLIDELSLSGSYNFLADSMKLSNISIGLRTNIVGNFGINLRATLDPYEVTPEGKRYDKLTWRRGNLGRILNTGWSFGYTFKSKNTAQPAEVGKNDNIPPEYANPFYDPYGRMDPTLRRQYMSQSYYDFSIPWSLNVNYNVNYTLNYVNNGTTGYRRNVTQTIGFSGNVTFSKKMSATFSGGYDISINKLTTSSISITRDLHCWQMSFSWIPFGHYKSWNFHIGVKAASLQDLKYEKSQSMYDNYY